MQRLDLGPIIIGVIATGGGDGGVIVVVVVTIGIKRTIDVVNLALSARDLHFIPWRAVFAKLSFSGTAPICEFCCCFCFSASRFCLGSLEQQIV